MPVSGSQSAGRNTGSLVRSGLWRQVLACQPGPERSSGTSSSLRQTNSRSQRGLGVSSAMRADHLCSRAAHATYWRHNPLPIRAVHSLRGGHTFVVDLDGDPRHDIIMHHRVCRRGKPSRRYGASPTSQHRVVSQSVSSPMIGVRSPCMTRAEVPGLNGLRACADATYWVRRRRKVDAKPENRRPTDPSRRSRWAHSITEVAGIGVEKRHRG